MVRKKILWETRCRGEEDWKGIVKGDRFYWRESGNFSEFILKNCSKTRLFTQI